MDNAKFLHRPLDRKFQMKMAVEGIYMQSKVMYLQIRLSNESSIDYDIDQLRCIIRDQRKAKRTAVQENEVVPLHVAGNTNFINALRSSVIVIAVGKFTIPDAKLLIIQLHEKNGGRHLTLKLRNRHLLKAKLLHDQ
jgi:conjugative transposon TraN protein